MSKVWSMPGALERYCIVFFYSVSIRVHIDERVIFPYPQQFVKRFAAKQTTAEGDNDADTGPPAFVPYKVKVC